MERLTELHRMSNTERARVIGLYGYSGPRRPSDLEICSCMVAWCTLATAIVLLLRVLL